MAPEPATNHILRYETAIRRQLEKAIDRLAILQQRRVAAAEPAPSPAQA